MPAFFTFLTRILPAFRAKVYPHNTRILAKSDPQQIVATLIKVVRFFWKNLPDLTS